MKSILLHVQDDPSLDRRLDAALALARACGGHLGCLHVTPVEAYVAMDSFGGVFVMQEMLTAIDAQENVLRKRVEERLSREEIGWDYEQVTGSVANVIISRAALSDVVVVGRERHSQALDGAALALLGDLLHRSRTPLLVPAKSGRPYDPTGPALIGWDGSYEAANAVRGALGLLRLASDVRVVRVEEIIRRAVPVDAAARISVALRRPCRIGGRTRASGDGLGRCCSNMRWTAASRRWSSAATATAASANICSAG